MYLIKLKSKDSVGGITSGGPYYYYDYMDRAMGKAHLGKIKFFTSLQLNGFDIIYDNGHTSWFQEGLVEFSIKIDYEQEFNAY